MYLLELFLLVEEVPKRQRNVPKFFYFNQLQISGSKYQRTVIKVRKLNSRYFYVLDGSIVQIYAIDIISQQYVPVILRS